ASFGTARPEGRANRYLSRSCRHRRRQSERCHRLLPGRARPRGRGARRGRVAAGPRALHAPRGVGSQGFRAHFIPTGDSAIELLEATADDSPIAKYVAKRGPGIHHLTLRVPDIRAALARLKEKGVRLIDETPREGAHGSLVAFVHPSSAHGVLVELKETKDGKESKEPKELS